MAESILRTKSKQFAKEIIFVCQEIKQNKKETNLSNQLVRSGTSIGANIYEANYAQGKRDFISKLEIALKECYESEYWPELLYETNFLCESDFLRLRGECGTIRRLLIASCKTAKESSKK